MKKNVLVLICIIFIIFVGTSVVFAEETTTKNASEGTVFSSNSVSSINTESSVDIHTQTTNTSSQSADEGSMSLREWLLSLVPDYGITKELIDSLSDEQLEYAKNVSLNFGSQDVSGTAKFVTKIYGSDPIPKEAYSLNYRELTVEEMKQYIPQIRLSLIYGFDLDKNLVNSMNNQQFLNMINNFYKDKPDSYGTTGMHVLLFMSYNIQEGNYNSDSFESSSESSFMEDSAIEASTDVRETKNSGKNIDKKDIFPNTGERQGKSLLIIGISIITFLVVIVFDKMNKQRS